MNIKPVHTVGSLSQRCIPHKTVQDGIVCLKRGIRSGFISPMQMRSNPDEKSFKNKYNKEIRFTPKKLLITNNAGSFIEISDDHGIWIESDKDIHIRAKGQMAVVSEEQDVTLSAENVLRLRQKETSIKLSEDIILSGGEFRLQ